GQRIEPAVDLFHHAHHLPGRQLGALLVLGEIELRERLSLLADVTEVAAHAERAREVAHHPDDLHDGRILRNDFDVDQRVGGPVAGGLGASRRRETQRQDRKQCDLHACRVTAAGLRAPQRPLLLSHVSDAFATSFHPLSTVSEWPRSGNTLYSVTLGDLRYSLYADRDTTSGTVWSLPPPVISSGPRAAFVFTFAGVFGKKFASAA